MIDAFFCVPKKGNVKRLEDCVPYGENLASLLGASGVSGAVVAPCACSECPHVWNCAERRTQEVVDIVARSPNELRGLACYDPLRIGDSLRWIDKAITAGKLVGGYAQAGCSVSGLDAARKYPLYGLCAKLRSPMVIEFASTERWVNHRPQVEVVAADFPELDLVLVPPPETEAASIMQILKRFPRISFLLCPRELQSNFALREYVEHQGRDRVLFRSSADGWTHSVETALALPLNLEAKEAYFSGNAKRLFGFLQ